MPAEIYSKRCMWFRRFSTQFSGLCHTEIALFWRFLVSLDSPDKHSSLCCNSSMTLTGADYTKVFRCPQRQKSRGLRSGDHAGQLTRPLCSSHCLPKVWLRCCLKMLGKWIGAPSHQIHRYCHSWRGTCSKSNGKSFVKRQWYTAPVGLLGKTTGLTNWSPKMPTQKLMEEWHYSLDAMVVWGLWSTQTYYENLQYPPLWPLPHQ